MSHWVAVLADQGSGLVVALSLALGAGAVAVRLSRVPLHRERLAELTLAVTVAAIALLLLPLPRPGLGWLGGTQREPRPAPATTPIPAPEWSPPVTESPPPAAPIAVSTATPDRRAAPRSPELFLARAFLAGALALAAHLALSFALLARTLRRATPAPEWVRTLARERDADRSGRARIVVHERVSRPFCCGFARGTIVLPASLARRGLEERVAAVLLHEGAHLALGHPRGRVLSALAAPLLYWHPLYWWLVREMRRCAELLADDVAVARIDRRRYVEELLRLAESARRAPVSRAPALGALGGHKQFLERMESLLMRRSPLTTRSSRAHVVARSVLACALLGSLSVAWGRPLQDAEPGPPRTTRVVFAVSDGTALGAFLLLCADAGIGIERLEVRAADPRSGARTASVDLRGAEGEVLAGVARDVEGIELIALQELEPATPEDAGADPRSHVEALQRDMDAIGRQIRELTARYENLQASLGDGSTPEPAGLEALRGLGYVTGAKAPPPPAELDGAVVTATFGDPKVVAIDRGQRHGVREGETFDVYQGSVYRGRVHIVQVGESYCIGRVTHEVGEGIVGGDAPAAISTFLKTVFQGF